jgi:hypothetical protein
METNHQMKRCIGLRLFALAATVATCLVTGCSTRTTPQPGTPTAGSTGATALPVDPSLLPSDWHDVEWISLGGDQISAKDNPQAIRAFLQVLRTPARIDQRPLYRGGEPRPYSPFAIGLRGGRTVVQAADYVERSVLHTWRARYAPRGSGVTRSVRLVTSGWKVKWVYDTVASAWLPATAEQAAALIALYGSCVARCGDILMEDDHTSTPEPFDRQLPAGLASCRIELPRPAALRVCHLPWLGRRDDSIGIPPATAVRLRDDLCDEIAFLPRGGGNDVQATVYYRLKRAGAWRLYGCLDVTDPLARRRVIGGTSGPHATVR